MCAATATRTRPSSAGPDDRAVPTELPAAAPARAAAGASTSADTRDRRSSSSPTTDAHTASTSSASGRRNTASRTSTRHDPVDPERPPARAACRRSGTRCRPCRRGPTGRRPAARARTGRPSTPAVAARRRPGARRRGRRPTASPSPTPSRSTTTARAAASASARKVSGSARTSLRSAETAAGDRPDVGPTSRNSACASDDVRPVRSVRAPPTSDHPPPRPGCG